MCSWYCAPGCRAVSCGYLEMHQVFTPAAVLLHLCHCSKTLLLESTLSFHTSRSTKEMHGDGYDTWYSNSKLSELQNLCRGVVVTNKQYTLTFVGSWIALSFQTLAVTSYRDYAGSSTDLCNCWHSMASWDSLFQNTRIFWQTSVLYQGHRLNMIFTRRIADQDWIILLFVVLGVRLQE